MPANIIKMRNLYESYVARDSEGVAVGSNPGVARKTFIRHMRYRLGLGDKDGNDYKDRIGNRVLRECPEVSQRLYSEDFSLKESMEAIVGPGTSSFLQDSSAWAEWRANNFAMEQRHPNDPRALLEATGVGISPSAFADINAWTAQTSGLLERRILEQFVNPDFIGDIICPDEQTRMLEGQKVIGVGRVGPKALIRNPGQPHPRAGIPERWVTLPRTNEYALAIDVTFEAAWADLTGQLLETAAGIGEWLAYQKELRKIDSVIGVVGSTGASTDPNAFQYGGVKYALYSGTEALPIPQNSQSNPITNGDFTTVEASWLLGLRMHDPETKTRINIALDTLLAAPVPAILLDLITGAKNTQRRTSINQNTATQAGAETLTVQDTDMNPAQLGGRFAKRVLTSTLLEQRMTDASGLNLSQTNANAYFWHLAAGKSHKNQVNWPLTIAQLPMASSYEQTDRRIIQSTFVSERSTPGVRSIWHAVQNTN